MGRLVVVMVWQVLGRYWHIGNVQGLVWVSRCLSASRCQLTLGSLLYPFVRVIDFSSLEHISNGATCDTAASAVNHLMMPRWAHWALLMLTLSTALRPIERFCVRIISTTINCCISISGAGFRALIDPILIK